MAKIKYGDVCETYSASTLQQLSKKVSGKNYRVEDKDVFPVSVIQAIFDGCTGMRLDSILNLINCVYIPYKGKPEYVRDKVACHMRRKGLIISYRGCDNESRNEVFVGNNPCSKKEWLDDRNWKPIFINIDDESFINQIIEKCYVYLLEHFVDDKLSHTSGNAVENRVVTNEFDYVYELIERLKCRLNKIFPDGEDEFTFNIDTITVDEVNDLFK